MAAITDVTLVSGAPTAGDGTVSTLDKFNGTAGSSTTRALTVQGITSGTPVPVSGTFWQATQPVSAASLPLPTGAATSALQTTGNTSLATIATNSGSALAAGTALIGKVGIDQTSDGTTNAVHLVAGTAVIGHVIVDTAPTTAVTNAISDPALSKFATGKYVTVAASTGPTTLQTSAGATGDYISGILVIPSSTSPGAIVLTDNATAITVFAGGASSLSNLVPFFIPLGAVSASGAWKITTLANASVIAIGKFS